MDAAVFLTARRRLGRGWRGGQPRRAGRSWSGWLGISGCRTLRLRLSVVRHLHLDELSVLRHQIKTFFKNAKYANSPTDDTSFKLTNSGVTRQTAGNVACNRPIDRSFSLIPWTRATSLIYTWAARHRSEPAKNRIISDPSSAEVSSRGHPNVRMNDGTIPPEQQTFRGEEE